MRIRVLRKNYWAVKLNDWIRRYRILIADEETPQAFLWHTLADSVVPVENSLEYVKALRRQGVKAELHIFPDGEHGLGLSLEDNAICRHNAQWKALLLRWLHYIHYIQ